MTCRLARRLLASTLSATLVLLSPGLEAPRLFAQVIGRAAPVEGVRALAGLPLAASNAALTNMAAHALMAPTMSAPSAFLAAPLAAPVASHALSATNRLKPVAIIARAQDAGLARPGLEPSDAPSGALDRALVGVSPAQLDDPDAVGVIYGRLWDGLTDRRSWDAHREVILAEVEPLRANLAEYARLREEALGTAAFDQELDKGKVLVVEPGLGKAEMTLVDRRRIIRVTHARTELAVIFIDAGAVAPDSIHLRRLIGRQFFDAGSERQDGRRGRSAAVVWQKAGLTVSGDFHEKPRTLSRDWWKWSWRATYKTPDGSDVLFGAVMSVIQGALAAGLGALKLALLGTPMLWAPVLFTMAFGFFIGAFVSTYKNWTYRGSKMSQFFKSALISLAFAYPVIVFTRGLGALALTSADLGAVLAAAISWAPLFCTMAFGLMIGIVMTTSKNGTDRGRKLNHYSKSALRSIALAYLAIIFIPGLGMHRHILSNVALNNVGKVVWQQIPAMGEKHRQFTGMLFGKFKKAAVVNQGFYMVNWTLRLGDLLEIPGGKVVFLLGMPFAMILSYWYARKHGFPEGEEMRRLPVRLLPGHRVAPGEMVK